MNNPGGLILPAAVQHELRQRERVIEMRHSLDVLELARKVERQLELVNRPHRSRGARKRVARKGSR